MGVKGGNPPRLFFNPGPQTAKLSEEYLRVRNRGQRAKARQSEMLLARARGELIERRLVELQGAFVMTAFRQKMLGLSARWARAFVGLPDVHAVKKLIDEMARSTLTELSSPFVEAITDPDWLAKVQDDGEAEGPRGRCPRRRRVSRGVHGPRGSRIRPRPRER
jgi:hypothetical protein